MSGRPLAAAVHAAEAPDRTKTPASVASWLYGPRTAPVTAVTAQSPEVEPGARGGERSPSAAGAAAAASLSSNQNSTSDKKYRENPPSVRIAEGGSFLQVRIPSGRSRPGTAGIRQRITRFTRSSRLRLLRHLNCVDRREVPAGRVAMATLTYPEGFPPPAEAKLHLEALFARYERAFGKLPVFWKLEPQARGAPHFHLMLFMRAAEDLGKHQDWWARNWAEVVGSADPNHLAWHQGKLGRGNKPCVEQIRTWNGVVSYAGKYLGKACENQGWEKPGRFWGIHKKRQLPVSLVEVELTLRAAVILRRAAVRWYEHQHSGRYVLTWPSGNKRRDYWTFKEREAVTNANDGECTFTPIRRKWTTSRGGIGVFMPWVVGQRLLAWAIDEADRYEPPPRRQRAYDTGKARRPADSRPPPGRDILPSCSPPLRPGQPASTSSSSRPAGSTLGRVSTWLTGSRSTA